MTLPEKIERARRRREDELLLMLLLLADDGRRDATVAIRHGFPVQTVLQNTFDRAVPAIVGSMIDAHNDAAKRVSVMTGEDIAPVDVTQLTAIYLPPAREAAIAMTNRMFNAIAAAQNESTGISTRFLVRRAFDDAGYSRTNPTGLDAGAERAIVFASNVGLIAASSASGIVTAIRHISVDDDQTTEICRDRIGLVLPIDDHYWYANIPQLHWRCRSIIIPVIGEFTASLSYPTIPPDPGFGVAPPGLLEGLKAIGRRAA